MLKVECQNCCPGKKRDKKDQRDENRAQSLRGHLLLFFCPSTHSTERNKPYADLDDEDEIYSHFYGVERGPRTLAHETENDGEETSERHGSIEVDIGCRVYEAIGQAFQYFRRRQAILRGGAVGRR